MRSIAALLFAVSLSLAATAGNPARLADAIKTGDRASALALVQQKVDVNAPEPDGTTAIAWAVRQGDTDMVDRLIRAGADVKAANRYGVTPLSLACLNGDATVIEKLLKAGADVNAKGQEDETPLMIVARAGNVEAAKVLLAHGAQVDVARKMAWRDGADVGRSGEAPGDDSGAYRSRRRRERGVYGGELGASDHR